MAQDSCSFEARGLNSKLHHMWVDRRPFSLLPTKDFIWEHVHFHDNHNIPQLESNQIPTSKYFKTSENQLESVQLNLDTKFEVKLSTQLVVHLLHSHGPQMEVVLRNGLRERRRASYYMTRMILLVELRDFNSFGKVLSLNMIQKSLWNLKTSDQLLRLIWIFMNLNQTSQTLFQWQKCSNVNFWIKNHQNCSKKKIPSDK